MKTKHCLKEGFSLVEIVIALGVTAFALITILGLLPAGIGANQSSIQQTEAVDLATGIVADLRQTPSVTAIAGSGGGLSSLSPRYGIDVTKSSATLYLDVSGNSSTTLVASSRYKVVVTLTQPPTGERNATDGIVTLSWPAAAPTTMNSVSTFIALDRN